MNYTQNQHAGATSIDIGAIPFLKQFLGVKNLLDIGCGPGGNVEYARSGGIDAYSLDGDVNTIPNKPYFKHVDYREESGGFQGPFDIGWSVEFAEHVPEEYMHNFFVDYKKCKKLIFTAAPPGWGGNGHVNEQNDEYWLKKFSENGFDFDADLTKVIRDVSKLIFRGQVRMPKKQFVKNRGLVFINRN